MSPESKKRADILLVELGLTESRSMAQRLVMAGQVRIEGQVVAKPSVLLPVDTPLEVIDLPKYVSRGGLKLEAALQAFEQDVEGNVCADVGASTGGFTDCLLQHGAAKVYAIDVGSKQLHWKLRSDERVVVMEQTNARHLESLPEPIDLVTIDASFISLALLLPQAQKWLAPDGEVIALIKPQFEVGKEEAAQGRGVIRDTALHHSVLLDSLTFADSLGLAPYNLIASPLRGPKGNVEFLVHLVQSAESTPETERLVEAALASIQE